MLVSLSLMEPTIVNNQKIPIKPINEYNPAFCLSLVATLSITSFITPSHSVATTHNAPQSTSGNQGHRFFIVLCILLALSLKVR